MSVSDLVALSGVPGLGVAVHIIKATYQTIDQVKVCQQQCKDLSNRCVALLLTLRDSSKNMEGTKATEFSDEFQGTIERIYRRVTEWAGLGLMNSVLQSNQIKEGIDRFHRDIDACMMKFNISINMELYRGQRDILAIQERDRAEFREILLTFITENMVKSPGIAAKASTQSPETVVEEIMQSPGTALAEIMQSLDLRDSTLRSTQDQERTIRATRCQTMDDSLRPQAVSAPNSPPASLNNSSSPKRHSSFFLRRPSTADGATGPSSPSSGLWRFRRSPSRTGIQIPEEVDPSRMNRRSGISVASISWPLRTRQIDGRPSTASPISISEDATIAERPVPPSPPHNSGRHFPAENTPSDHSSTFTASSDRSTESSTLVQAKNDHIPYVQRSDDGSIEAGTLEDLVVILTTGSDVRKVTEYRDIFLISHTAFASSEAVFSSLVHRFHEIDADANLHAEYRAGVRYNIIMVMKHWLGSPYVKVDINVLAQMKEFALDVKSSEIMSELANDVAQKIDARINSNQDSHLFASALSPEQNAIFPRPSPQGLAIALTILEGDEYRRILPADYISYLQNPSSLNNVNAACVTNKKIVCWVKKSILTPTQLEARVEEYKFFVNTARECRNRHNFQSMAAIINALTSTSIQRLTMTRKEAADKSKGLLAVLHDLEQLLQPDHNHRRYRAALKHSPDVCIPWIDVHLIELQSVFRPNQTVIDVKGRRLINFTQCIKFSARMKTILAFKSPNHTNNEVGLFSYLESQLRGIDASSDSFIDNRSRILEVEEKRISDLRLLEFKSLGFA